MRAGLGVAVLLAGMALLSGVGRAQGIDCSRARSPTEKAICASPNLLALDHQVAVAYASALARQPERREASRTELLAWLHARDAACNVPSAAIERCLSGQLTARLTALAAPPPTTPTTAPRAGRRHAAARPGDPSRQLQPAGTSRDAGCRQPAARVRVGYAAARDLAGSVHHRGAQPVRRGRCSWWTC